MRVNKTYTLIVKILRIVLPVLILLSITGLIIWTATNQEEIPEQDKIQISETEKPDGVSDDALQIIKPEFTGVDTKDRPYIITADTVYQGSTKKANMTLVKPVANLEFSTDHWVSLSADNGVYSPSGETLSLKGNVTLSDNTGYHLKTEQIDVDLKKGQAISKTNVTGGGPIGTIDAKGLTITLNNSPFVSFVGPGKFVLYPEKTKK